MEGMERPFQGIELDFRRDQEGRIVFFTSGILGLKSVGYIIPNEEKKKQLIKVYEQFTYLAIAIVLIGWYAIRKTQFTILPVFGVFFLNYYVFSLRIKKITQDLQVSDMCLPPRKKREAWTIAIIGALAIFAPLTILGFVFSAQNMGLKGILLYTSALSVAVLFVMVLIYRYARK